ncbi:MAG TPA: serine hydrolase domain-containing protein [Bryobacteraceae bacterium]|nr:serine hydrolase domain-containing protein [Bryobacteraceae bacterium]
MTRRAWLMAVAGTALRKQRVEEAAELVHKATASGDVRAAVLDVRQGGYRFSRAFGQARGPETPFLIASISKPMTAAGVMLLADRGKLALSDPVNKFIPEFAGGDRELVTVQHLLTHTSGLPDMLPENVELRRRHAPLADFVAGACRAPLLFRPGAKVSYQSMGILLASEIAQRITRMPFRDFLRREVFLPMGMRETSLGLGGRSIADTAQCQVENGDDDWNWNTPYWRDLGAPWGGVHATAGDIARFLRAFLRPDGSVLKRATAQAMTTSHTQGLNESWGLGWRLDPGAFGRGCSPRTFGHYGATGTVAWADAATGVRCVLLTTRPADQSRAGLLGPVSDLVSERA